MAFVVEDGTSLLTSTSYTTVQFFKDHFADRANDAALALTDAQIQVALMEGTLYVDATYRHVFEGRKSVRNQALQWPRSYAHEDHFSIPNYIIPVNLQKAVCEAALISTTEPLFSVIKASDGGITEVQAGPVVKKWAPGMSNPTKIYQIVDRFMSGLVIGSYGIVQTIRS